MKQLGEALCTRLFFSSDRETVFSHQVGCEFHAALGGRWPEFFAHSLGRDLSRQPVAIKSLKRVAVETPRCFVQPCDFVIREQAITLHVPCFAQLEIAQNLGRNVSLKGSLDEHGKALLCSLEIGWRIGDVKKAETRQRP